MTDENGSYIAGAPGLPEKIAPVFVDHGLRHFNQKTGAGVFRDPPLTPSCQKQVQTKTDHIPISLKPVNLIFPKRPLFGETKSTETKATGNRNGRTNK